MASTSGDTTRNSTTSFIRAEINTGLTFAEIALRSEDPDKRTRDTKHARKAYDAILHFMPDALLTGADQQQINAGLDNFRDKLRRLGEEV